MPAAHTPNLNLNKPDRQDLVNVVTDINDNMDTIDGAIGALPSGHTVQGQINTLKPVSIVLNPVTNANGEITVVTQDSRINEGLKAVYIEVGTPETFLAPIRITTGEGQIELYCANAVGSSTVTVVVEMATVTDSADPQPASVTSTEFDILANRIGTLSQLTTTQKTNVVGAINEINGKITNLETRTSYSGSVNSTYVSALEGFVTKCGKIVSGYFVFTAKIDFNANDINIISNLPASYNGYVQIPCIPLSGTDQYKASRARITTSGTITPWYGLSFKAGVPYLLPINYVCA